MKQNIIEITAIEKSKWYTCEICLDSECYERTYRTHKNLEEVRNICWDKIANILKENWHLIDYCNLC